MPTNNLSFLNDEEVRNFASKEALHEFIDDRKANDEWIHAYISETSVVGVPKNSPILIPSLKEEHDIEATDEALESCMQDMGLLLKFPYHDKMTTMPLRFTAITSTFERAGLTGRTLRNSGEDSLAPETKAEWLSIALSLYKDTMCKILVRDGKVSTNRSQEYTILPTDELISALEATLRKNWSGYSFQSGTASHEYLVAQYEYNDTSAENRVSAVLRRCGVSDSNDVKLGVRFVTSDVGNSAATLHPLLMLGNREIILGDVLALEHTKSSSIEKWTTDVLPKLSMLAVDAERKIEELANIKIKHPGGCLRNIASTIRLPKEASIQTGDELDALYVGSCTALDVFSGLFDIVSLNEERYLNSPCGGYTPTQKLRYQELCTQALAMNFAEKDIDFEWRN